MPQVDETHTFSTGRRIAVEAADEGPGMVLSSGDPVIIKSMGGLTQTIAKSRVASLKPLEQSLMYEPALLSLSAQSIADIAEYLKTR
jgi:putative heme-binding domain-containing protein